MTSSANGESSSYNQALCAPSSKQMCRRPGTLCTASTNARPFVSTTIDFSRLPDDPMTPSVQLSACESIPI
jgi:hypothetical protein